MEKVVRGAMLVLSYIQNDSYSGLALMKDASKVMTSNEDPEIKVLIDGMKFEGDADPANIFGALYKSLFAPGADKEVLANQIRSVASSGSSEDLVDLLLQIDPDYLTDPEANKIGEDLMNDMPPMIKGLVKQLKQVVDPAIEEIQEEPKPLIDKSTKLVNQLALDA